MEVDHKSLAGHAPGRVAVVAVPHLVEEDVSVDVRILREGAELLPDAFVGEEGLEAWEPDQVVYDALEGEEGEEREEEKGE